MSHLPYIKAAVLLSATTTLLLAPLAGPAGATRRCAPLVVQNPNGVECKVANFATAKDTGVVIKIYDHNGDAAATCGPLEVPAKGSAFCSTSPPSTGEVE